MSVIFALVRIHETDAQKEQNVWAEENIHWILLIIVIVMILIMAAVVVYLLRRRAKRQRTSVQVQVAAAKQDPGIQLEIPDKIEEKTSSQLSPTSGTMDSMGSRGEGVEAANTTGYEQS